MSAARNESLPEIRSMTLEDIPAVTVIESRSYAFPWYANTFRDCLASGYHGIVFERHGMLFGYGMLSAAVGEAHLLNLCIEPEMQGKGHGDYMLHVLIDMARELGARQMYLEVRESNDAAKHLYYRAGFNEVGLRKNYYQAKSGREDAVVFAKELVV
ncbi:MAG: ribosomal protein S18-alanine N-acetyltransferase [Gammaproteobacteria bacterium]|nr:ribosomal protein S18-alanine N-acetyltransferase [Gammaproteobacteria bacterium]